MRFTIMYLSGMITMVCAVVFYRANSQDHSSLMAEYQEKGDIASQASVLELEVMNQNMMMITGAVGIIALMIFIAAGLTLRSKSGSDKGA